MAKKKILPKCGIIMPISSIDGCSAEHWAEVLSILKETIVNCDFEPNLVSDADDIGIIQKRIIQNVYSNEIIVCDVSAKNSNVMFELGMRLAFDRPTIIIKDDKTDFSFDTSIIEHLMYPRDLRFSRINNFKEKLAEKIKATYNKSVNDPSYSTFLKNFGQYKIAKLEEKEVTSETYILDSLEELKTQINEFKFIVRQDYFNEDVFIKDEILNRIANRYVHNFGAKNALSAKLKFLKYVKDHTGLGLKETKEFIDEFCIQLMEQIEEEN